MPPSRSIYQSKTAVVNAVIALAPLYPPVGLWVQHNAALALVLIGLVNVALRLVSKGRVSLFGSSGS